jgi:hypothetical protein
VPESTMPSEEQMRTQMFKTMVALGRMADAVADHLTADKQPCETATTEPSEPPGPGFDGIDYGSVRVQCKRCEGLIQFKDYVRDYNSIDDTCTCGDEPHPHELPSDVQRAFLVHFAMRQGPQGPAGPAGPPMRDEDVHKIWDTLANHRKALAIIGVFAGFENVSFGQTEPGRSVRSLAGLSVCRECVGTGWLARDESCTNCKKGYVQP